RRTIQYSRHSVKFRVRRILDAPPSRGMTGCALHPLHLDVHRRALGDGLIDHAIALGELEQLVELVLRRVGRDVEAEPDLAEPDRRFLVDAERAPEIEIA